MPFLSEYSTSYFSRTLQMPRSTLTLSVTGRQTTPSIGTTGSGGAYGVVSTVFGKQRCIYRCVKVRNAKADQWARIGQPCVHGTRMQHY